MEENNSRIVEEHEKTEGYEFNFLNVPWDDRTQSSKLCIIALLVTISLATIACVINNLIIHYKNFYNPLDHDTRCPLVKLETTPFVARIYLVPTQELLCLGAVIGSSSVIANGACARSGPIRIGVGPVTKPQCKKGFTVDVIDPIKYDGTISYDIVLLTTMEKMSACSSPISLAHEANYDTKAFILGRPTINARVLKSLTRQPVIMLREQESENMTISSEKTIEKSSMMCVEELASCPVRAGDLLIQANEVVGLASNSLRRADQSKVACFTNLNIIRPQLADLMTETLLDSLI